MIFVDVPVERWQLKTGVVLGALKQTHFHCPHCLGTFPINKPFISSKLWGFISEIHDCGLYYAYAATDRPKQKRRKR